MVIRANWKGYLKIEELTCPVALHGAVSIAERMAFHTLNRATGHRVHRQFIDEETGKPVPHDAQVKGYETGKGDYVMIEPDEIAAAVPESDKTLSIEAFIPRGAIDDLYFDRPYYLVPGEGHVEVFALIREGMRRETVAALARCVLFRRLRSLLIRAHGPGLIATTLRFDYELRSPREAFQGIGKVKAKTEMLELARHIIDTKRGEYDPTKFGDRYDKALAELVRAKLAGKPIETRKRREPAKVIDLMEALRKSAAVTAAKTPGAGKSKRKEKPATGKSVRRKRAASHAAKRRRA